MLQLLLMYNSDFKYKAFFKKISEQTNSSHFNILSNESFPMQTFDCTCWDTGGRSGTEDEFLVLG